MYQWYGKQGYLYELELVLIPVYIGKSSSGHWFLVCISNIKQQITSYCSMNGEYLEILKCFERLVKWERQLCAKKEEEDCKWTLRAAKCNEQSGFDCGAFTAGHALLLSLDNNMEPLPFKKDDGKKCDF